MTWPATRQRGIQSIEVGGQLLRALVHHGRPMALKDLAREADMSAAKAHPYMVSFGRLGLIEQDRTSGHYLLGPLALQLGLISLQQANPVHVATPLIAELAQEIGQTVAIAVWGDRGATIVRIAESPAPVHVNMRHGTVFSLTSTASGRLFGAYLDADVVKAQLEDERRREKTRSGASEPGMPPPPAAARLEGLRGAVAGGAAPRPEPLRRRDHPGRERDVGAGLRPHRRHRAGAHRHRPGRHLRHQLGRAAGARPQALRRPGLAAPGARQNSSHEAELRG